MPIEVSDPLAGSPGPLIAKIYASDMQEPTRAYSDMHRTFEVDIILRGTLSYTFYDYNFTAQPGDVILIPAWEPHIWEGPGFGGADLVIQFLPEFLHEELIAGMSWLSIFAVPVIERPRVTSSEMRQDVFTLAASLQGEIEQKLLGWLDAIRYYLLQLLLTLVRGWDHAESASRQSRYSSTDVQRLLPALMIVYGDPSRHVGLAEAAQVCGLSRGHFATVFRKTMGLSFAKFAVRVRLKEAARLLHQTDQTVEVIAEQTGFVDHSHMRRLFTATFGTTPSAYRTLVDHLPPAAKT